jgi:hypothetical protein
MIFADILKMRNGFSKRMLVLFLLLAISFAFPAKAMAVANGENTAYCPGIQAWASQQGSAMQPFIQFEYPGCFPGSQEANLGFTSTIIGNFRTAFLNTIEPYLQGLAWSIFLAVATLVLVKTGGEIAFGAGGAVGIAEAIKVGFILAIDAGMVLYLPLIFSGVTYDGQKIGTLLSQYLLRQVQTGASPGMASALKMFVPSQISLDPFSIMQEGIKLGAVTASGLVFHATTSASGLLGVFSASVSTVVLAMASQIFGEMVVFVGVVVYAYAAIKVLLILIETFWTISVSGLLYSMVMIKELVSRKHEINFSYFAQIGICIFIRILVAFIVLALGYVIVVPVAIYMASTSSYTGPMVEIALYFIYAYLVYNMEAFTQIFQCQAGFGGAMQKMSEVAGGVIAGSVNAGAGAVGGAWAGHKEAKRTDMPFEGGHYSRHMAKSVMSGAKQGANSRQKDPFHAGKEAHDNLADAFKKAEGGPPKSSGGRQQQSQQEEGGLVDKSGSPVTSASFSPTPSNVRESIKYDGGGQSQGSQQFPQGSFQGPSSPGPQPTPNQPQSGPSGGGSVGGRGGRGSEDSGNSGRIITP